MNGNFFPIIAAAAALFGTAALSNAQPPPSAAVILPASPAAGPVGPVFMVEYSTDMPGDDLRPGFPTDDFSQCMDACIEDSECRSFTWVKPYEQPPRRSNVRPLCWIKGSVPNKMMHPGMISGIKQ